MKFLMKAGRFLASQALIICTFFAQIFSVFLILLIQSFIPAYQRAAESWDKIIYVLPVVAVLLISSVFVKINNIFFKMKLKDVIKKFFLSVLIVIVFFVIAGFILSWLMSLIPQAKASELKGILLFPLAILGFSGFLLIISLIGICLVCIIVFPLTLFAGFSILSLYEKFPKIAKIIIRILFLISLVVYFAVIIKFGFRRTTEDLIRHRNEKYELSDLKTIQILHKQNSYDFEKDSLGFFTDMVEKNAPIELLKQFIDYGYDLKSHKGYLDYANTKEEILLFLDHGVDPNKFIFTSVMHSDLETSEKLLAAGADINLKTEHNNGWTNYTLPQYFIQNIDSKIEDLWKQENDEEANLTEEFYAEKEQKIDEIRKTIHFLVEHGADLNSANEEQETALGTLLRNVFLDPEIKKEFIYYLVENGADPKICLPAKVSLTNMYYWYDIDDETIGMFRRHGRK